jgi:iron complex outermembrane receptor protein
MGYSNHRAPVRISTLRATISLAALVLATVPTLAFAAEEAKVDEPSEVIVTATRRSETLSKVAASVTAISAAQLGAGGIKDIGSLANAVPNVSVGDQFGVNRTFIRGIGMTSIDLGADGAVAFLQDGAILARPAAQLTGFYDMDRVEVLRGPQGTLYGRGATAGAINLITKRPTQDLEGYAKLTVGNYNARAVEAALGGPIVADKLSFRIAGKYDKRDGYGKNLFTGNPVDDRDAYAIRGSLLYKASSTLDVLISAETFREKDNNYAFHYFGPTVSPENFLGSLIGGQSIFTYKAGKPDLRNTYSDQDAINRRHGTSGTATVTWTPGAWDVKSITSYHRFVRFNRDDLDASNVWMFGQNNYDERSNTFSQEVVGNYTTDRTEFMVGGMYFNEHQFGSVKVPLVNLAVLLRLAGQLPAGTPNNALDSFNYLQFGTVDTNAYGLFAQVKYAVTDKLKLTLGGRYSYEQRKGKGSFQFLGNVPTDKSEGWGAFTPTAGLNYQATDDTLVYATVTRGFKSGVINVGSQNPVIDPEYAWGYETGIKTYALDRKVSANASLFYIDYTNLQVGFVGADSVVTTVNAAAARNYGAEIELRARPITGLEVELFATYLNARYRKFTSGDYRQGFKQVDLKGNRLSNAPDYSVRLAASYDMPIGEIGSLNLHGDINWQDRVYFTEFNNADATQGGYAMVNAGARFTDASKRWNIDVWGRNLTDKFVISNNIITAPLFSSVRVGSMAPPKTYGVTVGYQF